jgi:hypothetical protein
LKKTSGQALKRSNAEQLARQQRTHQARQDIMLKLQIDIANLMAVLVNNTSTLLEVRFFFFVASIQLIWRLLAVRWSSRPRV